MRTTLGDLINELVESYERSYGNHELATIAASVTVEEMFETKVAQRVRDEQTVRIRRSTR